MNESEIIKALIVAFPVGAALVIVTWLMTSRLPAIIDKATVYLAERNRGEKERAEITLQAQTEMVKATAVLADKFAQGMKDNQADSRAFYTGKFDEMRKEMKALEDLVHDLQAELKDKDERIEELERENTLMRTEIDVLRAQGDKNKGNRARKPALRKKAA